MTPTTHRSFHDAMLCEGTTSIATAPVPAVAIAPCSGILHKVSAGAAGTTTGTIAVAVNVNGGADITNGALTIAAGTGSRPGSLLDLPKIASPTQTVTYINEGDVITFTPSGGTGTSVPGAFTAIIREK